MLGFGFGFGPCCLLVESLWLLFKINGVDAKLCAQRDVRVRHDACAVARDRDGPRGERGQVPEPAEASADVAPSRGAFHARIKARAGHIRMGSGAVQQPPGGEPVRAP